MIFLQKKNPQNYNHVSAELHAIQSQGEGGGPRSLMYILSELHPGYAICYWTVYGSENRHCVKEEPRSKQKARSRDK